MNTNLTKENTTPTVPREKIRKLKKLKKNLKVKGKKDAGLVDITTVSDPMRNLKERIEWATKRPEKLVKTPGNNIGTQKKRKRKK